MNKDIVPVDGLMVVKHAYKLWKKYDRHQQKAQSSGKNWSRLSKAEPIGQKLTDTIKASVQTTDGPTAE